ncbi:hypothetical protein [Streptomyces zhihengii]|uniref:hypothetical protein n=1 Tax=Streptomyces zhihengii TaxID=1818004 RepID=UPI00360CED76
MSAHRRPGTGRTVHARFRVREIPGITVTAPDDGAAVGGELAAAVRRTAQRALADAGRGYLGGRVELRTPRPPARHPLHPGTGHRATERAVRRAAHRAVALAVPATLRGDPGTARVHLRTP